MKKQHNNQKKARAAIILQWIQILILAVLLSTLPQQNVYAERAYTETIKIRKLVAVPSPAPLPVNKTGSLPGEISAAGVIVIDMGSRVSLYQKNPAERLLPASTTKIMSALVALEEYHLDDVVTVKTVIKEGQKMDLLPGEKITVENLLYGTLVHSANDAAYALAEHHPQGVDGFVAEMNAKAGRLELTNTHYTNPIGFDYPEHYTSAQDLAYLSLYALKNREFMKIVGVAQITVSDVDFTIFHPLKNINELLGKVPGVYGVKTGWTEAAGQALVTTVQRNGARILIVLLKSADRFGETEALVNWVFQNYTWQDVTYKKLF